MITATVKYNDNYTDIEFPCSEAYASALSFYRMCNSNIGKSHAFLPKAITTACFRLLDKAQVPDR